MIAVVGPGDTDDASLLAVAEEVGRLAARAGQDVVTGGLGGVMAAAARGAYQAG
ncbi:MAG: TIGR00725 family protein, partial [Frankiaceae bacterium]|nr:TIGR00725 family protein [Frankiaceae bacterium]